MNSKQLDNKTSGIVTIARAVSARRAINGYLPLGASADDDHGPQAAIGRAARTVTVEHHAATASATQGLRRNQACIAENHAASPCDINP
ncbi:hypothetical protein [Lolliginicoccus suaedae]|uniref:hypothetical protein n=1 Tax=Lolliginicoccus suaedae TaxID=2605429 RepID=UPI0011F06861|nr:hypothetical protein [Lolliginicoccus suaedae]